MHFIQIINQFGLDFNKMLLKICHYERITKNICIKNNELNNLRELKQKLLCQIDPSEKVNYSTIYMGARIEGLL